MVHLVEPPGLLQMMSPQMNAAGFGLEKLLLALLMLEPLMSMFA
jgi:hypothetical protein